MELDNETAEEGRTAVLTCLSEGDPIPDMSFTNLSSLDVYTPNELVGGWVGR